MVITHPIILNTEIVYGRNTDATRCVLTTRIMRGNVHLMLNAKTPLYGIRPFFKGSDALSMYALPLGNYY